MISPADIEQLATELADAEPKDILARLVPEFDSIALAFSGAEDVVLVEIGRKVAPDLAVFTLDTGRLHPETYDFLETVREHYGLDLEVLSPDAQAVEKLVRAKGLFSFYEDGHEECCGIRKVAPLRRKLAGVDAWITGQRRDQSPTRTNVPVIQIDETFSTDAQQVIKINPLANWTREQVWTYIRIFDVPYNPLHDEGFISIGCQPCTQPVNPSQHEREGRWWWEEATIKECGLHLDNLQGDKDK